MSRQHKLFTTYPLDDEVVIDGERLSSPYHIYDGSILFIGGRANAEVASDLLRAESLSPIVGDDGKVLMALWVCNFTDANLGPHHELQISLFASFQPMARVVAHPLAIYRLLMREPQTMMVCHGLWNSTERVVRYNREHLSLDAHLCQSTIAVDAATRAWQFEYADAASQQPLVEGNVTVPKSQPGSVLWEMGKQIGLGGLMKSMREPFVHVPVVNTLNSHASENLVAHTYTSADSQVIFPYGDGQQVAIRAPQYAALAFQPDFVQCSSGVNFVYLRPEKPAK